MLCLQLPRFLVIGVLATALHVLVVVLLIEMGGVADAGFGLVVANGIAWASAVLFSYLGHHRWTFRVEVAGRHAHGLRLPRFVVTSLMGLTTNLGAVLLIREVWGQTYEIATLFGVALSVVVTFTLSKLWTFQTLKGATP